MRQVLTYPDLPPVLTQAAGDQRYLPLSHAPGTDPHPQYPLKTAPDPYAQYLTQARADTRYSQLPHNHDASYSLLSHNHSGVYSPAAHLHTGTYLPLTGGTLSGVLRVDASVGVGVTPQVWNGSARALQLGPSSAVWNVLDSITMVSQNTYYDATDQRALVAGASSQLRFASGGVTVENAPTVAAGAAQTFTTRLTLDLAGNLGLATAPRAWRSDLRALDLMTGASLWAQGPNVWVSSNTVVDAAGHKAPVAGVASYLQLSGGEAGIFFAPSVAAGATQSFRNRHRIDNNGQLYMEVAGNQNGIQIVPDTGTTPMRAIWQSATVSGQAKNASFGMSISDQAKWLGVGVYDNAAGGQLALVNGTHGGVGGSITAHPFGGMFGPGQDNAWQCGEAARRWNVVFAVAGAINTSVYEAKEAFAPLDPVACATAVLETDWVDYRYVPPAPPEPPPPPEGDDDESVALREGWDAHRAANEASHRAIVEEHTFARHQRGYVLQSPAHKVADLFGLDDRKSASPGSDLAVVACALQGALKRIATLETHILALEAQPR